MLFNQSPTNTLNTTKQLLRLLKVKISHTTLKNTLEEHPDYPSLLSIADALSQWKIKTMGIKITFEQLLQIPTPFLAHFNNNEIVPVISAKRDTIVYIHSGRKKLYGREAFLGQWDGVALLAAADEKSGEPDYMKKRRMELMQRITVPAELLFALLLAVLTGIAALRNTALQALFPLLLSLTLFAGMIVSSLLLWYEIDKQNPILQKICTAGRHTNCSAVLQSRAAKLWGIITWSEIGFAYFTGGFLSLLLCGFDPSITNAVAWLNLLATPYILFSVFYQWRLAKQWCMLCLTVQFLLLTGFLISLTGNLYIPFIPPVAMAMPNITLLAFAYVMPLLTWRHVKPLLLKSKGGNHYKAQLLRLKHDQRIFEALLPKQKSISLDDTLHLGIILGKPEAKHRLVKVCNPYCGPCARAHMELEHILENNPNVQVQIIFMATNDEKDRRRNPARHLMAIAQKGDKELMKMALGDWYNTNVKDYNLFAARYPLNELQLQGKKLNAMHTWCEKTGIAFTPTFFIDGYQMPEMYSVEDLKYLLA